jgi:hypothetical protein
VRAPEVSHAPVSESEHLQQALGNQGMQESLGGGLPEQGESNATLAYLLDDAAAEVRPGQMRRGEFLQLVERAVYRTAEDGLAPVGRTARDCPYLRAMFRFYGTQDAAAVARALRRYAPETSAASSAEESAWLISARVRDSVRAWASTGKIERAPEWEGDTGELVGAQLQSGPGQALGPGVRGAMESAFGESFGHVRAHEDGHAAQLARNLNARAVTLGNDIYFGRGEYTPGTLVGDAILAHELAHVTQQRGATATGEISEHGTRNEFESDADQAAGAAVHSTWTKRMGAFSRAVQRARVSLQTGLSIQRCGGGDSTASGPMSFTSSNFDPKLSGAIRIDDEPGSPGAGTVHVYSQDYRASGDVTASGGRNRDAADWEAGFLQTAISKNLDFDYQDASNTHVAYLRVTLPGGAHRDGDRGIIPWYGNETVRDFPSASSTVTPSMSDRPGQEHIPWQVTEPVSGNTGKLKASTGTDEFCSWLVVRQKSTGNLTYLNWDTWEVDWGATYDPVAKTGSGTGAGCRVIDKGEGKGAVTPILVDPVANGSHKVEVVP